MRKKKVFLTLIASALFVSCLTSCNDENNGNNVNNSADNSSSVTQSVPSNNDSNTKQQSNSNSNTQTQDYNISDNETSKKAFDELVKISNDISYDDFLKNGDAELFSNISVFKYKSMTISINYDGTFNYLIKYTYDDNDNELLCEEYKYINNSWTSSRKIEKEYFENSNVLKVSKDYSFDSNGIYSFMTKYIYDINSNKISYEASKYVNDSWILTQKSESEYYDNSNKLKSNKYYSFDSDGVYRYLEEYTKDENGNTITSKESKYINDSWLKVRESKNFGLDHLETIYELVLNDDGTYNTLEESTYDENDIISTTKSKYINDSWVKIEEMKWKRDADGSRVGRFTYKITFNNDGSFNRLEKSVLDDNLNTLSSVYSLYSDGKWVYVYKYDCTYDESGNRLTDIDSNYYNGEWVYFVKQEYTYDESGNRLTDINSNYYNGEWVYYDKYEYTYDTDGNEVAKIRYNYVDNKWDKTKESIEINGIYYDTYNKNDFYIYEYTYDENANILTTDISIKINDNWVKYKSSKLINGKTKTIYWLHIIYENEFDYSDEYEYDEQANIKTHIVFRYKDNKINSGSKYEYEYDEKNNETLEIYYSYKNGEWIPSTKQEYEYNEGNHKTLFVRSEYKNGEWVYNYKIEYIFDQYGNQTGTSTYIYENGEWVKQ